jgi:hypothetical protein
MNVHRSSRDRPYTAINGDCVDALKGLPDHCIGYSIFSPPFASLYTYSNSPRDMGNVRNDAEFFDARKCAGRESLTTSSRCAPRVKLPSM